MEVVRSSPAVDRIWIANSHYHRNCLGRLAEAEREYRASIAEYDLLAVEYPLMAFPLNQLGDLLADRREPEAVPLLERSLAIRRRTLPPSSEFLTLNERHQSARARADG